MTNKYEFCIEKFTKESYSHFYAFKRRKQDKIYIKSFYKFLMEVVFIKFFERYFKNLQYLCISKCFVYYKFNWISVSSTIQQTKMQNAKKTLLYFLFSTFFVLNDLQYLHDLFPENRYFCIIKHK